MEPFQALYFVRHNLRRIATVLVMVALTGLLYVGGSYLSNIEVEFLKETDRYREFAYVNLVSSAIEDSLKKEILNEIAEDETLKLIPVGGNDYRFPTVMSFENGDYAFSYTAEDFLWINERTGWVKDTEKVKENTLFVTKRYGEYLKLKEGELFEQNREEATFWYGEKPYTIQYMEGDCFGVCLIAEESAGNMFYLLTWSDKGEEQQFWKRVGELEEKYEDISIETYEERYEMAKENFAINGLIFISIIVVVVCVFFITINAVLVGIYDKRKSEFQLYEAIGIPRRKVKGKVVRELLLINGIGMVFGVVLIVAAIAFLNLFVYRGTGLHLYYYHPWALWSFLICNGMILFPSIVLRLRWIAKNRETV